LRTVPLGSAPPPSLPAIPSTSEPSGRRTGTFVVLSPKHGLQISGPPKAKSESVGSASSKVEAKVPPVKSEGMPTYSVVQPSGPRVAR
jgi:hypothetical protein